MILSILYIYAFGIVKIQPSTAPGYDASKDSAATGAQPVTMRSFYCATWAVTDVLGTHALASDVTTPLAKVNV